MPKRYRVTQYEQLSEAGKDFARAVTGHPAGTGRVEVTSRDYRWLWQARLAAFVFRGESAGLGLRLFTTEVVKLG